jgi:predicted PurR-regulated permease PerM
LGAFAWGLTALVLTVFILASFERLREGTINLVVASKRERTAEILDGILSQIGAYLLGALSIGALAGISAWIFLTIAGVPYAALLALLVALLDLVPQIGATIGATVSILVALTVSLGTAIAALVFFILYQQIENWIIYPRVMQNAVKITNLAAIVSVLIGAALFGVTGVVLAIPVYASLRLVYKEIVAPKLEAR